MRGRMKKVFLHFFALFCVLAFVSCSGLSTESSSSALLSVRLPGNARSAWSEEIKSYEVTVASGEFSQTKNGSAGETVAFSEIPVGQCEVTVLAKDSSGETIGKGVATARIEAGKANYVKITVKKYSGNEATEETEETDYEALIYDGTVSLNGQTYSTLSEALIAAKTAPEAGANIIANTITFNGNVKETLLNQADYPSENDCPGGISQNLIIDLNGYTFYWDEFTTENANEYTKSEQNLFVVGGGKTLVIKDGSIVSDSNTVHSAYFMRNVSGNSTLVLSNLNIRNISSTKPIIDSANGPSSVAGLYMDKVSIKDCKVSGDSSYGVSVTHTNFYAESTTIENVLGSSASVSLGDGVNGAFVGGSIILSSDESLSTETEMANRDNAIFVSGSGEFFISSSTVYANTNKHGYPVQINASSLNLSDGFKYKYFNIADFTVYERQNPDDNNEETKMYVTASTLGLKQGSNVIAAAQSSSLTTSEKSTEYALYLASDSVLYMSGSSEIYGLVQMNCDTSSSSAIAQTGKLTSNVVTRLDFGSDIANYENKISGNCPLYWAGGAQTLDDEEKSFNPAKFAIYNNANYKIGATTRKVSNADTSNGNTIYAPVPIQN